MDPDANLREQIELAKFLVEANHCGSDFLNNAERLGAWKAVVDDRSQTTSLVAIQGPRSAEILAPLTDIDLASLRYYAIAQGNVAGVPALVRRDPDRLAGEAPP